MKEKKSRKLIVIIVILAIALLASTSYIIYDKVWKKEEKTEEKEKTKTDVPKKEEKERILTEEEQTQIENQIKEYTSAFADSYPIDEETPLENQKALNFALVKRGTLGENIMESDIEKILENYFGKDHSYRHEDIDCFIGDGVLYQYNSAKREYIFQDTHGHGGPGTFTAQIYYIDGTVKDNQYTVNVHILYGDYCGGVCGPILSYYKTAEDSMNGENPVLGPYEDYHTITNEEYESVKANLPITTFSFEKDEDNNYGLKAVELK